MAVFGSMWQTTGIAFAALALFSLSKIVYRLFFHPLAKFPGPFLAAITYKYEFYFDGIQKGQYNKQIVRFHELYGPIVRINPNELHCNDPKFIDQIYAGSGKRRHKAPYFYDAFGPIAARSGFATVDHQLHRVRRKALDRFFSKGSITKLESKIQELAQKLCDVMLSRSGNGKSFDLTDAYSCFTTDVVSGYCFGQEQGLLEGNDFSQSFRTFIHAGLYGLPAGRQWPMIPAILQSLPDAISKRLDPDIAKWVNHMNWIESYVQNIKDTYEKESETGNQHNMFIDLLESDLPPNEKAVSRLGVEAGAMINAGTETTAWTLTVLTYHLLAQPKIYERLVAELRTVTSDPKKLPNWNTLEALPFLSATILEAIRLSYGLVSRLGRIAPDEALVYEGSFESPADKATRSVTYVIPPNTAIAMSHTIVHHNETIFPDSRKFIPDRWLTPDNSRRTNLEKYLMSFSKGSRQCLGMNLAYCELYFATAALALRVLPHLELFETTEADVQYQRDFFIPMPALDSKGARVIVR